MPRQSDEERAREALARGRMRTWPGYAAKVTWENTDQENRDHWLSQIRDADVRSVAELTASIRAEGSAERAKLEAALRKCRPLIGCFAAKSATDLVEEVEALIGKYDWFAQPAESGATEAMAAKDPAPFMVDYEAAQRAGAKP